MLPKAGVSPLTFAFNTGDNVLASIVIEHPSAAKLEPKEEDKKVRGQGYGYGYGYVWGWV